MGFTLVELLLAIAIIGLTLGATLEMFIASSKTNEQSMNEAIALNLAQQRIEEIKKLQYGGVTINAGTGSNSADGFLPALNNVATDVYLTNFYLTDSNTYRPNSSLLKMDPQRRVDIITQIEWVDDSSGGTTQDYKKIKVTVFWQELDETKSVFLATYVYYESSLTAGSSGGGGLPDTGQTQDTTVSFGEDSDYNSTATQPSYTDNADGTITDNITGLMWVKSPVAAGIGGAYNWENAITACEGLNYAGYTDWRLPNIKELWSIAHYQSTNPSIAVIFTSLSDYYWSGTTLSNDSTQAFSIDFSGGQCKLYAKSSSAYIRPLRLNGSLVDTAQTASYTATFGEDHDYNPAGLQPNYADNGDGTVSDNLTGLMWIKSPAAAGIGGAYSWENAVAACEGMDYAGYTDWRLPNLKELMSIINYQNTNPAVNTAFFSLSTGTFWSSTSSVYSGADTYAEGISAIDGKLVTSAKTSGHYIIAARGGP